MIDPEGSSEQKPTPAQLEDLGEALASLAETPDDFGHRNTNDRFLQTDSRKLQNEVDGLRNELRNLEIAEREEGYDEARSKSIRDLKQTLAWAEIEMHGLQKLSRDYRK